MQKILIVIARYVSIRNASFELARRLESAGHQVVIACSTDYQAVAEANGVTFRHLAPLPHQEPTAQPGDNPALKKYRQQEGPFIALLDELQPSLVLIDVDLPTYTIAAWGQHVPVASLSIFIGLFKRPGVPPTHYLMAPTKNGGGFQPAIEWAWVRNWSEVLWKLGREWVRTRGMTKLKRLRLYAESKGFPHQREFDIFHWLRPIVFRNIPVLMLHAQSFDFPHIPYKTARYLGPMIQRDRAEVHPSFDASAEATLAALFEKRDREGRTLIYCTFGTYVKRNDRQFLQRLIAAAALNPTWDIVIGLGDRHKAEAIVQAPPANVYLFDWVPQMRVLAHTDCAIIHGGTSSVYECIDYGVPMLVYPFAGIDQPGNAARVEYHGLGIVGDRESDSAETISKHVQGLIDEPTYREALSTMRASFDDYDAAYLDKTMRDLSVA